MKCSLPVKTTQNCGACTSQFHYVILIAQILTPSKTVGDTPK